METISGTSVRDSTDSLAQAIASHDNAYDSRFKITEDKHLRPRRQKFKPLVLSIEPSAVVRLVGSSYECFIGGEHVPCQGPHRTPDRAWLCLARVINARRGQS